MQNSIELINEEKEVKISWRGTSGKIVCTFCVKPIEKLEKENYLIEFVSLKSCLLLKTSEIFESLAKLPDNFRSEVTELMSRKITMPEPVLRNGLNMYISCPIK